MKAISVGKTHPGKLRSNNEDSFLIEDSIGLFSVADGIGGHQGGEVASRLAVETLADELPGLLRQEEGGCSGQNKEAVDQHFSVLGEAFNSANAKIRKTAAANRVLHNMGTTLTCLLVCGRYAYLSHIGDSRAYRSRSGALAQISEDHSVVAELLRAGLITPGQALSSPQRHVITRALGIDPDIQLDQKKIEVRPHDTFLLCTDGLTEMVDDAEINNVLQNYKPEAAAAKLVELANDGGGIDNITVVVIRIEEP